jgi:hypothetical protein
MRKHSTSLISMVTILHEIVQEAGDLNNVQPYEYTVDSGGYEFETEDGLKVHVEFEKMSDVEIDLLRVKRSLGYTPDPDNAVNVGYSVNNIDTQAKKTDYRTLVKILKTVGDIVIDYAKSNPEVVAMSVIPANKDEKNYTKTSDPQKLMMYQAILVNNIDKMPGDWNFARVKYFGLETILLFKK